MSTSRNMRTLPIQRSQNINMLLTKVITALAWLERESSDAFTLLRDVAFVGCMPMPIATAMPEAEEARSSTWTVYIKCQRFILSPSVQLLERVYQHERTGVQL